MHFTLDALESTNTHRRGRWIGFATCPCGLASVWVVWGKAQRALFFVFEVVRVDVTVQKRSKKCAFLESLLLKTPQIWPISDPTPTLTGGGNQKKSVYLPVNTLKTILKSCTKKDTESVLFCVKRHQKTTKNTPNLQIQKENNKKSNEIRKQRLTMLSIMITMLPILITLEIQ